MLRGKYTSRSRYLRARLQRSALRAVLRGLQSWGPPPKEPLPGYTIAIACHRRFPEMLIPNLRLLADQDLAHLDRVLIAFDGPREDKLAAVESRLRDQSPGVRFEFFYQSRFQARVIRTIGWAWVDIWLSYCKCLAATKTRYVLLHDMDAMLLKPGIVEERFAAIRERGDQFVGTHWYHSNGFDADDRMVFPVEMFADAAFLRSEFRPVDMFNHVSTYNGKTVDFDVMLYPQADARRSLLPLPDGDMVHPGQVISQYVFLTTRSGYVPPAANNLFFIPYFLHLAGDSEILDRHARALETNDRREVPFLGSRMDLSNFSMVHADWVDRQIRRIDGAIDGAVREDVDRYIRAVRSHAKSAPDPVRL